MKFTLIFVEQPDFHSLNTCEGKRYHKRDAKSNIQSMILPCVK